MRMTMRFAAIAAMVLMLGQARQASAWEAPYIQDAIKNGVEAAKKVKDLAGYGPRTEGFCMIGGFVAEGGDLSFSMHLKQGKEYVFIGVGDRDVKDLDIEAIEDGKVIAHDTADDNTPVVALSAVGDANVTLKMKLEKAGEGDKHFCLLMVLEDTKGAAGGLDRLEGAAKELNTACAKITDKNLQFDQEKNTICFAAALLEPGADRILKRTFHKDHSYLMIGSGDEHCKDLDVAVSHEGTVVCKDDAEDATPIVALSVSDQNAVCDVKLTMHTADKPSFAVLAVLEILK